MLGSLLGLSLSLAVGVPAAGAAHDDGGVTATTVAQFAPTENAEGITVVPNGTIYVSTFGRGEVWAVATDGTHSVEAVLDPAISPQAFGVLGVDSDHSGRLYVSVASGNPATNGVWTWRPGKTPERIPGTEAMAVPNASTTDHRAVYMTDSFTGQVWRADGPGRPARLWSADPLLAGDGTFLGGPPIGANGIAVRNGVVYVAVTDHGRIVALPIRRDGSAGAGSVYVESPTLKGIDGLAVGPDAALYAPVNRASRVVRIDHRRDIDVLAAAEDGLDFPGSVAFGRGSTARSLFVVNMAIGPLFGMPQTAGPGVVRLDGVTARPGHGRCDWRPDRTQNCHYPAEAATG